MLTDILLEYLKIIASIENNTCGTSLNLGRLTLDDEEWSKLEQALQKNSSLFILKMSISNIKSLSQFLAGNNRLQTLDLCDSLIGNLGAVTLSEGLAKNQTLQILDLQGNDIGNVGIKSLAQMLEKNKTLHILNLAKNKVGNSGATSLAVALEKNNILATLILRTNRIGKLGADKLAQALKKNQSLDYLDLAENRLDDEGAKSIAEALKKNSSLRTLNLSKNQITDVGATSLLRALEKNNKCFNVELNEEFTVRCSQSTDELMALPELPSNKIDAKISEKIIILVLSRLTTAWTKIEKELPKIVAQLELMSDMGKKAIEEMGPYQFFERYNTLYLQGSNLLKHFDKARKSIQFNDDIRSGNKKDHLELLKQWSRASESYRKLDIQWFRAIGNCYRLLNGFPSTSFTTTLPQNEVIVELNRQLEQDIQAKKEEAYINAHPQLKKYYERLSTELYRFITCYFLVPVGILKPEDNKKEMVISAINSIPIAGQFLNLFTKGLSYLNRKHRLSQTNRLAELFKSLDHISEVCRIFARQLTLAKERSILQQEEMHYSGLAKIQGLFSFVSEELQKQWKDLATPDKTGVTYIPQDKFAVLDMAFLLQQILSDSVKIKKDEDLPNQFFKVVMGQDYQPRVLRTVVSLSDSKPEVLLLKLLKEQQETKKLQEEKLRVVELELCALKEFKEKIELATLSSSSRQPEKAQPN